MTAPDDKTRRAVIAAFAGISLGISVARAAGDTPATASKALVAYFSRSGNTRVVAGLIHRALGADLFEIQPATPYPEDYLQTVDLAREQRDRLFEPQLKGNVSNMATYDTVYLGFPIWGGTTRQSFEVF